MKKTEQELRQEIIDEYSFEEGDERIDKILEVKKDRYTATQAKKKAQSDKEAMEKGKNFYKKQLPKKGDKPKGEEIGEKPNYSLKDIRALSKVHDDDVDRVTKFAKTEKTSIADAMKHDDMQAILKGRAEKRKTAEATNTGKGSRGSSKATGTQLLEDADERGKLPETDEDMEALAEARLKA